MEFIIAPYYWMAISFYCMLLCFGVFMRERKTSQILYATFHLCCALWGLTVPLISQYSFIKELDLVILPSIGATCAGIGVTLRYIKNK